MKMYYNEDDAKEMFYEIINEYKGKEQLHGTEYSYTGLMELLNPQKVERAFNIWIVKLKENGFLNTQISTDVAKNTLWSEDKDKLNILRKAEALAKEVIDGDLS